MNNYNTHKDLTQPSITLLYKILCKGAIIPLVVRTSPESDFSNSFPMTYIRYNIKRGEYKKINKQ